MSAESRGRVVLLAVVLVLAACTGGNDGGGTVADGIEVEGSPAEVIEVSSSAFADGEPIPVEHTCDGQDVPPPITWSGVPDGTAEIVVTVEDPDAPSGTFVHWLVVGIPPDASLGPDGVEPHATDVGENSLGNPRWTGPCPPPEDEAHRYEFTVYAVDSTLDVPLEFSASDLNDALQGHVLARGSLSGTYERS